MRHDYADPSGQPSSAEQLQWLYDRTAITDLLDRYARVFDERTFTEELPEFFVNDAYVEFPPGGHRGVEGMDTFHMLVMAPFGRTQHILSNYIINLGCDTASFRANALVTHELPSTEPGDGGSLFVVGGVLAGHVVRKSHRWWLCESRLEAVWRQGDFDPGE